MSSMENSDADGWGSEGEPKTEDEGSEVQDSEEEEDEGDQGDYGFDAGPDAFAGNKVRRWLACTD